MSISPAQKNSSPAAPQEPLASLLERIRRARALGEPEGFDAGGEDPLGGLLETIAAEAAYQSQTAPTQWPVHDDATASRSSKAAQDSSSPGSSGGRSTAGRSSGGRSTGRPAGTSEQAEALVGREVLALLRERSLGGEARAAAVERLAAQLVSPDPDALRDVLAILVSGQTE